MGKKEDLLYLTRFMPVQDATFYNSIILTDPEIPPPPPPPLIKIENNIDKAIIVFVFHAYFIYFKNHIHMNYMRDV